MSQPPVAATCYRHPDKPTYISCQRCGRPICGDCMINAAVGFQCPDCVRDGARETRQNQLPFGGSRTANSAITSITLIAINVGVWVAVLLTGGATGRLTQLLALSKYGYCSSIQDPATFYPGVGAAACSRYPDGQWMPGALDGGWWQVITSGFTHVQLTHIGLNMLALWFIGPPLERILGRARFLAIYLLSLLAGSAAVLWFPSEPYQSTLGASGAIFGLLGALLVLTIKTKGDMRNVLIWLGINLVATFMISGISWQAHVGGLIGGLAASAIIMFAPRENRSAHQIVGLVALALLIGALLVGRALLS